MKSSLLLLSVLICLSRTLQIQNKPQQALLAANIENGNEMQITKDEGSVSLQLSKQLELPQLNQNALMQAREQKIEAKNQFAEANQGKSDESLLNTLIDDRSIKASIVPINEDLNLNANGVLEQNNNVYIPGLSVPISTLQTKQDESSTTINSTETTTNPDGTQDTVVVDDSKHNLFFGPNYIDDFESTEYTPILTLLVVAVMGLLFILILAIKDVISANLKPFVAKRLRYVSRDVLIIMIVLTAILWLDFQGLNFFGVDMMGICLYWSIAALIWFAYCAILAWLGHVYSGKLDEKERKIPNQHEILEKYQKLSERIERNENIPYSEKSLHVTYESDIAYFLLRQSFICPSHLPPVTETFLRRDFSFSEYMTLCLEKDLDQVFTLSLKSFFSILLVAVFWMGVMFCTSTMISLILFCIPIPLVALITLIIKAKFLMIEKKLRSLIGTPQGINLLSMYGRIDPAANLGNHVPLYLSATPAIPTQTKPGAINAHERLFWFSSPKMWLSVLHMLIMIQLTWGVIFYGFYVIMPHTTVEIVLTIISTIILLADLLVTIPTTLFIYTTITNIEMMKDRELIKVAILNQRRPLQFSLIKLYRALKAQRRRRRSIVPDEGKIMPLKGFYLKTIDEAIDLISPNDEVRGGDLPVLAHLCGSKLERDELIMLARELGFGVQYSPDEEEIPFEQKLTSAIEQRTQDVKNEPYQTSFEVLSSIKPHENAINSEDLETFLTENDVELSKEDLDNINHEMKYLSPNGVDYDLFDLSSLIRNDIEQHAR